MATALGFSGEVADFYQRYRRGYPAEVFDAVVAAFDLTGDDVILDLGLAPTARRGFSKALRRAVGNGPFREDVSVRILVGTV
jgi:hypothetical protein